MIDERYVLLPVFVVLAALTAYACFEELRRWVSQSFKGLVFWVVKCFLAVILIRIITKFLYWVFS